MLNMQPLEKKIISIMFVIAIIGSLVSFVFFDTFISLVFGIWVGTVVSVYRLLSLGKTIDRTIAMDDTGKAANAAKLGYLIRFGIVVVVCLIAAMNHHIISLWGVLFGTANMQISTYIFAILEKRKSA